MTRRIVLLFDGTWNRRKHRTNVSRMHASIVSSGRDDPEQPCFYDEGVGTKWYTAITGGAFGRGLTENILEGYAWLSRRQQPGDDIYIFGFSRGAYTARSLAGLIRKCGLLNTVSRERIAAANALYRDKDAHPDGPRAQAFRAANSRETRIRFIGVWDTVGALGVPLSQGPFSRGYYQWHDTELSKIVDCAYHAVATDEHRRDFDVTVWSRKPGNVDVEQRWFAGSHSDVGGGGGSEPLTGIALRWLQDKAESCGLTLQDKATIGPQDHLAPVSDSFGEFALGIYRLFRRRHHRPFGSGQNETVDESVWRRWAADPAYRPPSLRNHPQRPADPSPPVDGLMPQPAP